MKKLNDSKMSQCNQTNIASSEDILPSALSCKSEESLDSGIFSRQKSCESVDSLTNIVLGINGNLKTNHSSDTAFSATDEVIPPLPIQQYEDYIRECQDIQQSIIIRHKEEGRTQLSRSNSTKSTDDQQEDDVAAEWLQRAGLSDLVTDPTRNQPGNAISRDSLSSMTVLLTLTRPQREAVLRRITSFNKAHMNKKPPKPALKSIFPSLQWSTESSTDGTEVLDKNSGSENEISINIEEKMSPAKSEENTKSEIDAIDMKLLPMRRPRSASGPQKLSTKSQKNSASTAKIYDADANNVEAKIEITSASMQSLPVLAIPTIKPIYDVSSRSSFTSLRNDSYSQTSYQFPSVRASVSLPDINSEEPYPEAISSASSGSENLDIKATYKTNSAMELSKLAVPPVIMRTHSVGGSRKVKALSDIPIQPNASSTSQSTDPARLRFETEDGDKKALKPRKSSKGSSFKFSSGKNSLFTFGSTKKGEKSPRSIRRQNNKEVKNSPELKKRFLLSPSLTLSIKRRSPTNSPLKVQTQSSPKSPPPSSPNRGKTKQSPLRKFSSMSLSNIRPYPKRSGSYKFKQGAHSPRKSLRRSRSLKSRDKPSINVAAAKRTISTEPKKPEKTTTKAPSVEASTNNSKRDESWKCSKDNVSLQGSIDESRSKGMSFTAETAGHEALPNYSLVRDRLGITKISDLSWVDVRKVQSLALIELSALFDVKKIEIKKRKAGKSKFKESGVFGTPISTLLESDKKRIGNKGLRVPLVLTEIIAFLEANALKTEGVLRKCGSTARTKLLKQDIDMRFGNTQSNLPPISESKVWQEAHPHDVATLLKQFLRELPIPLLSAEYIDAFQSCRWITDRKEQLQALNLLIILLNDAQRDSLKLLLKFLTLIVANVEHNKMCLDNVAMITAPNLFITARKSKKDLKLAAGSQDLKLAAGTSNIVRMLIKYHKLLWVVPAFMLSQVRHMNESELSNKKNHNPSKEKIKLKLFQSVKGKDSSKGRRSSQHAFQPFDCETPKGLIRVQAPNMNLTSIAVQLTNQLTASDVLAKYRRHCERMHQSGTDNNDQINNSNYALYEIGGNIYERCLDPGTNVMSVLHINPEAGWIIRHRSGK